METLILVIIAQVPPQKAAQRRANSSLRNRYLPVVRHIVSSRRIPSTIVSTPGSKASAKARPRCRADGCELPGPRSTEPQPLKPAAQSALSNAKQPCRLALVTAGFVQRLKDELSLKGPQAGI